MKKFDTVLFDFDGTIMNTNEVILRSWQHTFQTIEHRDEDVAKIIKTFGEPLEVTMKKFFPDVPVDEAVEIYRSYHRDNFGDLITVFPGMKNLLRQVKERGEKIGLVTSRLAYTTQQGLEKYDLKDYFDVVVTAEDTKKHKPDPEPVNIALAKLDSRPEHSPDAGGYHVRYPLCEKRRCYICTGRMVVGVKVRRRLRRRCAGSCDSEGSGTAGAALAVNWQKSYY